MDLVTPGIGLLFWMTVSFLVLLFLLKKFAWPVLLKMIRDRENEISSALNSAETAKAEMAKLTAQNEQILKEARLQRDDIIRQAKDAHDKIMAEAQTEAKAQADKIIQTAKAEIAAEKENAMAELSAKVGELSVEIAEKILRRELSSDVKQGEFMNELVKNISLN